MGTTGSGRLGAYRREDKKECPKEISFKVEDIELSNYFLKYKTLPAIGDEFKIKGCLVDKRLVVMDEISKDILGNVPVEYNYLYERCILRGYFYYGQVVYISERPLKVVLVEMKKHEEK